MRFQIKHLLLLTTAWAVLITSTYLHAGFALVLALIGIGLLAVILPVTLVVFAVGAVKQRSLRGGMSRVFVALLYTILALVIVVVVSWLMFGRHFGP